jgi:uracil-DNA glycosylase
VVSGTGLDRLLDALAARPSTPAVTNPYAGVLGEARLENLRRYLQHVREHGPTVALIGEAPGYRGCAVTGIPLTSRNLLASDLGRWGLFSPAGFAIPEELGIYEAEATATIVWRQVVDTLPSPPVTGNAFPFHPHPPGNPARNRALTAAELDEGRQYLVQLLALFPHVRVVAIGRQAARSLARLQVSPAAVLRHPAHGGATAFVAGFRGACLAMSTQQ